MEVGSHLVEVYFNEVMLKNFPYVIKVYDTSKIKVNRPDRAMMDESIKLQSKYCRKFTLYTFFPSCFKYQKESHRRCFLIKGDDLKND